MTTPGEKALAHVRALFPSGGPVPGAPITVNFHPDRPLADGRTVIEHLAVDGVYRTRYETGISNGGLGGDRPRWEQRMFGDSGSRPVYGALNLAGHPDGAAPRFGSCHLELRSHCLRRATFSLGDSHTEPDILGTAGAFGAVWEGLLAQVTRTGNALGVSASSVDAWVAALGAPRTRAGRALDDYVETQIHDRLTLSGDVAAVVADPSFRGTAYEGHLRALGLPLRWHGGFRLPADELPDELRGPQTVALGRRIAARYGEQVLDAALLGRAARDGDDPQLIKYLWHILVIKGRPA
ncbi:hypothetical protein GCM10010112_70540 [Actinoplanes lobatus]|uniref:DUF3626 domain-containing protein n=1 Tax=Actinoplanes lobatus TaxID=113568 RepID=A0A7W7HLY8_9ACTN|nr:DUF3626 domain-containing protein [Actinoplanes lobatus]MBB4752968.1 hypothetical protein [Actinoplanes lobatus]GGN87663.1 hypothetical protein GCM10010112_70540 [Actinoplanes lobatus]GIE39575.1 hypothetical protein Alo02nite_24730 [Actinoplanes lobatus]